MFSTRKLVWSSSLKRLYMFLLKTKLIHGRIQRKRRWKIREKRKLRVKAFFLKRKKLFLLKKELLRTRVQRLKLKRAKLKKIRLRFKRLIQIFIKLFKFFQLNLVGVDKILMWKREVKFLRKKRKRIIFGKKLKKKISKKRLIRLKIERLKKYKKTFRWWKSFFRSRRRRWRRRIRWKRWFMNEIAFEFYKLWRPISPRFLFFVRFKKRSKKNRRKKIFLYDLLIRFPQIRLKKAFRYFLKRRRIFPFYMLPAIGNMHITPRFLTYRGVQLSVGSFNELPYNHTIIGICCPYLTKYRKTSLWNNLGNFIFSENYFHMLEKTFLSIRKFNLFYNERSVSKKVIDSIVHAKSYHKRVNYFLNASGSILKRTRRKKFRRRYEHIKQLNLKLRQVTHMRRNRRNFNLFCNVRFRDHRLSKFIKTFYQSHGSMYSRLLSFELNVAHLLVRLGIVFLWKDAIWLVENDFVFVNGLVCNNINYSVKRYDRFQLAIGRGIYTITREKMSYSLTKIFRIWNLYARIMRIRQTPFKMQGTSENLWVIKSAWINKGIPGYLEVDFITLTAFIIYLPMRANDFGHFFLDYLKLPVVRFYNWRHLY